MTPMTQNRMGPFLVLAAVSMLAATSCHFDSAYRDIEEDLAQCSEGVVECRASLLTTCTNGQVVVTQDCGAQGMACSGTLLACTPCPANSTKCDGADVLRCDAQGQTYQKSETCDGEKGIACRTGACVQLCQQAQKNRSNVGCE